MYAVIRAGGKQHRVKPGDVIEIDLVRQADSGELSFTPLLVVDDDGKTHVGKDLGKAKVTAKVLGEQKGDKVKIFKYRPKTGYSRRQGHRQMYTLVEIEGVPLGGARKATAKPKAEEPKAEEPKAEEPKAEEPKAEELETAPAPSEPAGSEPSEGATVDAALVEAEPTLEPEDEVEGATGADAPEETGA
jgi:large subunit ribosomal protein L21